MIILNIFGFKSYIWDSYAEISYVLWIIKEKNEDFKNVSNI